MLAAINKFQKFEDILMLQISHIFGESDYKLFLIFRKIFIVITRLGDGQFYPIVTIFLIAFSKFELNFLLTLLPAFSIERSVYYLLKNLTKRIRPFEKLKINNQPILPPDKYSFPSGHTSAAFLFATLTSIFFPAFTSFVFIFAFLVGISRIILNLHYPTDVFIGSQLGISIGIISYKLMQIILV